MAADAQTHPTRSLAEIEAQLIGPGGPFELVEESVLGERMAVFRDRPHSLRELLESSAGHGDAEYLVFEDLRLGFREHERVVASVAAALRDRYGVGKGDRVAILAANCPEWIVTFWACASLGAVAVGLNGWWVRDEILFGLGDCEPRVLIADRQRLARLQERDLRVPVVEIESDFASLWSHAPDAPLPDTELGEDDPATILYTSGTTGRPKGAVNTHRNIVALTRLQILHGIRSAIHAASSGVPPAPGPASCALVTTPLFHVSGLYSGVVTLLSTGVKSVWTRGRFDPVRVMQLIETEQVRNWGPTGTMLHRLVHHPDVGRYDLSSVTHVGSGGAPIARALQERMREVFPNARRNIGVGYGLTEATALATLNSGETLREHPDAVGRPLPTVQLEIRDGQGAAVGEAREGEIHLRGPLVMKEYWRRPEATSAAILPGRWLRTGDIGRIEGGLLFVHARKRDLILRGGENVYPAEIEQCLELHPTVREAAVVGVENEDLGQVVKAIVVPEPEADTEPDPQALRAWVAERLAYFKVPAHWEFRVDPLPRNASGKVMKAVLTGEAENGFVREE